MSIISSVSVFRECAFLSTSFQNEPVVDCFSETQEDSQGQATRVYVSFKAGQAPKEEAIAAHHQGTPAAGHTC